FGPEGYVFEKPDTVVLAYEESKLPSASAPTDVTILRAPLGSPAYDALTTTVLDGDHVESTTLHFSVFGTGVPHPLGCDGAGSEGKACNDGDPCTQGDHCVSGACAGTPYTCDDSNPCTTDSCNGDGSCTFAPNTAACDDGDACTQGDVCS